MGDLQRERARLRPSRRFAFSLATIGALAGLLPWFWSWPWYVGLLGGWTAIAFGWVATAYALDRPGLLMKRADGSQPLWLWLVLGPYLALVRFSFWLYCRLTWRRLPVAEIVPGLWFARRLGREEASNAGAPWVSLLDLAAEFPRPAVVVQHYRSLPLLDGAIPTDEQLEQAAGWISQQLPAGPVLVHCAFGHGRTGLTVLHWLLQNNHVTDVAAGVERLKQLRPGFDLSRSQAAHLLARNEVRPPGQASTL
jgi:protein-tyrosine phosphatase